MKARAFELYQRGAGVCDASTGLLLLFTPAAALRLMRIERLPSELVYMQFIGAFVFGVGLSYLLFSRFPRNSAEAAAARAMWIMSAVLRIAVGGFVSVQVLTNTLEARWAIVAFVDLLLAAVQLANLRHLREIP